MRHIVVITARKDVSRWLHINMLSLDGERVICQKDEPVLREMLVKRGLKPIELNMTHCFYLGGSFHCWTSDIRRRGKLMDYGLN
jgi:glycine amidinotransferase